MTRVTVYCDQHHALINPGEESCAGEIGGDEALTPGLNSRGNATERKAFNHNGEIVYSEPVAWGPRYNGLNIYCRIVGAYHDGRKPEQAPVQVIVRTNVKLLDPGMVFPNGHKPPQDK